MALTITYTAPHQRDADDAEIDAVRALAVTAEPARRDRLDDDDPRAKANCSPSSHGRSARPHALRSSTHAGEALARAVRSGRAEHRCPRRLHVLPQHRRPRASQTPQRQMGRASRTNQRLRATRTISTRWACGRVHLGRYATRSRKQRAGVKQSRNKASRNAVTDALVTGNPGRSRARAVSARAPPRTTPRRRRASSRLRKEAARRSHGG